MVANGWLEWQAYREVKGKVATELWMDNREVFLLRLIGRINGLHTHVETHDKVVEVQTDTQSVAGSQLFEEGARTELSSRLFGV